MDSIHNDAYKRDDFMTAPVFNRTYENYLSQIRDLDLPSLAPTLGAETEGDNLIIPFFGTNFTVSHSGICELPLP